MALEGVLWGAVAMLCWGVGDFVSRSIAFRIGGPNTSLLIQIIGTALPLALVAAAYADGSLPDVDWGAAAIWASLSGTCLAGGYISFYTGLHRGAVSVVSSASSGWLAVTVIVAVALFGEQVTIGQGLLLAVVLAGIITLSTQPTTQTGASAGFLYGLGATMGLGMALAFMDKVTDAAGPVLALLLVRTFSFVPTFLFITLRKEDVHLPKWGTTLLLLAVAGMLDASGFLGYNLGVEAAPIALVAPVASAHPVATVALAIIFIRERPRALQWAGAALTVAGVIALSSMSG